MVSLPDGRRDLVALDYRWNRPDRGERRQVYSQDGRLRTTSEISTLTLVGGMLASVFWPMITIGWLRGQSRRDRRRSVRSILRG